MTKFYIPFKLMDLKHPSTMCNVNCSKYVVRNRLRENGYRCRRPAHKELLTARHMEQRMAFALQHFAWENEWENTIFSDEKVFSTDESGRVTLW